MSAALHGNSGGCCAQEDEKGSSKELGEGVQELASLEQQTGEGRIQLRLTFKRGLHPFYPPAVQVTATLFSPPIASHCDSLLTSRPYLSSPQILERLVLWL